MHDDQITKVGKATSPSQTITPKPTTPTDTIVAEGTQPTVTDIEKPYNPYLLAENLSVLTTEDGTPLQIEE
jgi:hypothetical protein